MYAIASLGVYDARRVAIIDRISTSDEDFMTPVTTDMFLADAQSFLSGTGTAGGVNTDTFLTDAQSLISGTGTPGAGAIVNTDDFLAGAQSYLPSTGAIE